MDDNNDKTIPSSAASSILGFVEAIPNSSADPEQYNKENDNVLQPIKGLSPS